MAASLVGGAALGPVFDVLFKTVGDVSLSVVTFPSNFQSLKKTLDEIRPVFADIESLSKALDGRDEETEMFKKQLMKGEELVRRCVETKWYHVLKKWKYTKRLTKFENSLVMFCQTHGLIQMCRDSKKILVMVNEHGKKLDDIHSMLKCSPRGSTTEAKDGSTGGTNVALQELEVKLLKEKDQMVVVAAPASYSKTTLAEEDGVKSITRYLMYLTILIIVLLFTSLFFSCKMFMLQCYYC